MIYIENFQEGQHIIGHYLCKDKQAMKTRAGKTYYNVLLMDKTGTAMGKIWDMTPQIGDFNKQEFIKIDANVTVFQGDIQLNINRVRRSDEGEYDPADYMQVTKMDPQEMFLQ
ncbi:MAG: hydrolase, partial [Clostridia bacterium]